MGKLLEKSLAEAPVIKMGDYNYVVHPITDGIPFVEAALLNEVVEEILKIGNFDVDYILTAEAMGIPLATALSLRTGIPFSIIRKRRYGLKGEKEICQKTGYSSSKMYINGLKKGHRVIIVDDMLSTGGTLKAILTNLKEMGVVVQDVVIVIEKKHAEKPKKEMEKEFNIKIKSLIIY
ncbi:MAG TPA: adenine phosphoribosyltransferase [Thermoplasmata archaeon]|nr:adenine phosphoribosyltransferase [Thermoplasmata archaeon]